MRTIKFRAWHEPSKQMFEWDDFSLNGRNNCIIHVEEGVFTTSKVDDNSVILEQFTGLQDKNGNNIYEGDILYYDNDDPNSHHLIQWNNELGAWENIRIEDGASMNQYYDWNFVEDMEVIGNIHENPELL